MVGSRGWILADIQTSGQDHQKVHGGVCTQRERGPLRPDPALPSHKHECLPARCVHLTSQALAGPASSPASSTTAQLSLLLQIPDRKIQLEETLLKHKENMKPVQAGGPHETRITKKTTRLAADSENPLLSLSEVGFPVRASSRQSPRPETPTATQEMLPEG